MTNTSSIWYIINYVIKSLIVLVKMQWLLLWKEPKAGPFWLLEKLGHIIIKIKKNLLETLGCPSSRTLPIVKCYPTFFSLPVMPTHNKLEHQCRWKRNFLLNLTPRPNSVKFCQSKQDHFNRVGSWPYPKSLNYAWKNCQGQTLQLIMNLGNLGL